MYIKVSLFLLFIVAAAAQDSGEDDGCHDPIIPHVGSEPLLAADACLIKSALLKSPPDYDTVSIIYENGKNNEETTLKSIATAEYDTELYRKYAKIFEDPVWLDTRMVAAIEGEEPFNTDMRRQQVIKVLAQSGIPLQRMFWHLDEAVRSVEAGDGGSIVDWDRAIAVYYGIDADCAPFGVAQNRGIEFGTISDGASDTNKIVHDQFFQGFADIMGRPTSVMVPDARLEIIRQTMIIYIQSVLKYATLAGEALRDGDDSEKQMAEGYAYYITIYPLVADVDSEGADQILDAFDLKKEPTLQMIQQVEVIFTRNYKNLNITAEEVNNFDPERKVNYVPPSMPSCVAQNPFGGVRVSPDADR